MSTSKTEITKQFNRAKRLGWLPYFEEAARIITNGYFDTADLIAIGSRETNLDPKWLKKPGDGGHGFGLMQIDIRSFPTFTKSDDWKNARKGVIYGAKVLKQKWTDYEANIGKNLKVTSSKGATYHYKAERAEGAEAQHLVLSGYNCGRWSQYAHANNQDIDKYSTGGDYGRDVMRRAAMFRQLLKIDAEKPAMPATQNLDGTDLNHPPESTALNFSGNGETLINESEAGEKLSPPPLPDSTQTADQITNIDTADKTAAVAIDAAQNAPAVEIEKPVESGFLGKVWKVILGVLGGTYVIPKLDLSVETVELLKTVLPYLATSAVVALVVWHVTKKINNFHLTKLKAEINTDVTRKDIRFVESSAPKLSFWQRWGI